MRGQIRPCVVSLSLALLRQGFLRSLMISPSVSRRLDIKAVKKAVGEYERIAGAKVNFDKSEGLRLGAWRGSNTLSGSFRWSDGPVRILRCSSGPTSHWSEIGRKYKLR